MLKDLFRQNKGGNNQDVAKYIDIYDSRVAEERKAAIEKYSAIMKENNLPYEGNTIVDSFFENPSVVPNTLMILGVGKGVRGNTKNLLDVLNKDDKFKDLKIYLRTSESSDSQAKKYIEENGWSRTETLVSEKKYNQILETVQVLVTETAFTRNWIKRPGQIYINTWHGTPLKTLGIQKKNDSAWRNVKNQKNFIDADLVLFPNDFSREVMIDAYRIFPLSNAKRIMLGYPRTGGMLKAAQGDLGDLKKQLAPNGEKLYAYMPTFREYMEPDEYLNMTKDFLEKTDKLLSDDELLYVNLHHRIEETLDISDMKHIVFFPKEIDSYVLLATTEALITDYSSVLFDYLTLKRHIVLYIPDIEEYDSVHGLTMKPDDLPFDKAYSPYEVVSFLRKGKTQDDTAAFEEYCKYDSPDNAEKLCDAIYTLTSHKEDSEHSGFEHVCDELDINSQKELAPYAMAPHSNGMKKLLIYTDFVEKSDRPFNMLKSFLDEYDGKKYQCFTFCEQPVADENRDRILPMYDKHTVVGAARKLNLSTPAQSALTLYREGILSFEEAIEILKYDHAIINKRMYGSAEFDEIFIYDTISPQRTIAFAETKAEKTLFIWDVTLEEINNGNDFLRKALIYVAPACKEVCVPSNKVLKQIKKILPENVKYRVLSDKII